MSEITQKSTNSIEIIQPFVERIAEARDVQILGGLGMAALVQPNIIIENDDRRVIVPEMPFLPAHREDGTKRDVDVLVLSSDPARVSEVSTMLDDSIGDALEKSVFDIRPSETLRKQLVDPLGFRALRTLLSDRYEKDPYASGEYVKSLFPFSVPLTPDALETWTLVLGQDGIEVPIPHPGTTLANYTNRSISGLRPRDADKITHVAENVFGVAPEIKDWMMDGPGKSQIELSTAIASLRHPDRKNLPLIDGLKVNTYSHDELMDHPSFMIPEYSKRHKRAVIGRAVFKAHALNAFESNPLVVTLWRQFAEHGTDAIIKNA